MKIEGNEVLEKLPRHLIDLVIDQPYNEYTALDHAVWRYVMRQNVNFLGKVAHKSYLKGLEKTGISVDSIPHMYGMNRILKEIGWAAVAVDGFIPPQAFMEFQAYNVLVIAADIRNIDHIEYTPAPDIIHEAAGHAPIIADPEYADYLRLFGEVGSKAFSSAKDYQLYEAIRHLSIIKEDPYTKREEIKEAEKQIEELQTNMGVPSEMSKIRNLHWWTVEYGLIGELNGYKLYGAGLLSSIGESASCLDDQKVKKLFYDTKAADYTFDITTQQPQLFVTPSFKHLTDVLMEFSETLAWRRGGLYGLQAAKNSGNIGTVVYSSGLQVSGTVIEVFEKENRPAYFRINTPTQLCFNNKQLAGHGKDYHQHGFGSPIGKLKGFSQPLEEMNTDDLQKAGIAQGEASKIEFESGVKVNGVAKTIIRLQNGKIGIISFHNCTVTYEGKKLFEPEWGVFDMAVGENITSVYSGPADPMSFGLTFEPPKEKTHKIEYSEKDKKRHKYYQSIRNIRDHKSTESISDEWKKVKNEFPEDWLLALEILELCVHNTTQHQTAAEIQEHLLNLKNNNSETRKLILDGLKLIENNFTVPTL